MSGAGVPEAPVNKNRNSDPRKDKIRPAKKFMISAPASDLMSAKKFHERHLGLLVTLPSDPRHHLRAFNFCENVSHFVPKRGSNLRCQTRRPVQRGVVSRQVNGIACGRKDRTTARRTNTIRSRTTLRNPLGAMPRPQSVSARGAIHYPGGQIRPDGDRGRDTQSNTMREQTPHGRGPSPAGLIRIVIHVRRSADSLVCMLTLSC